MMIELEPPSTRVTILATAIVTAALALGVAVAVDISTPDRQPPYRCERLVIV